MNTYILETLLPLDVPAPRTLSSLIFNVPFPQDPPDRFLQRYSALRQERNMEEESHYEEPSGLLALEVYIGDDLRTEREDWISRATSAFHDIVAANKSTLRHVELILPTGGIAAPLNLLGCLKEIENLQSFCVQWVLRGYLPMTILLMSQWGHILDDTLIPAFAQFYAELMALLATHAKSLKRLRISLPQSTTRKPFSALSINVAAFPTLPALELLDLTHWSPRVPDITALLASGKVSSLQHLILDHGAEISLEEDGWPALGAYLTTNPGPPRLRSLSAALLDARYDWAPVGNRLDTKQLRELLAEGAGEASAALDGLALCTAWPLAYEAQEPRGGNLSADEDDLYTHAPVCGHLAYPADQRPTTGLWPADSEATRMGQVMAGRPWY
ncbi:hypothetical protein DFH08DRAFT_840922 [Mycena albidolilacea]|uniref:Uncharacterized protein n=1 Tax=Mycena albidolilacea TaxID=1033008 RepID=A0AAD7ALN7_9AGAR|nr:hypothetical protein DFH08DRAFT_840922 [Mycena albidolilacea]